LALKSSWLITCAISPGSRFMQKMPAPTCGARSKQRNHTMAPKSVFGARPGLIVRTTRANCSSASIFACCSGNASRASAIWKATRGSPPAASPPLARSRL
jgi:hypothetical protein